MSQTNRWDRRDHKRHARKQMKVDGAGTKMLQRIIGEKARKVKRDKIISYGCGI